MLEMYNGAVNSPETTITNNISNTDTLIYVLDETKIPSDLPNIMVLGTGAGAETIKVLSINEQALTVERAFQGTAKAWNAGTIITRNFTEYDYKALKENVEELEVKDEKQNKEIEEIKTKDIEQDEKISQLSNPNLLINGDFQIWQRGTHFIGANFSYTTDHWFFLADAPSVGGSHIVRKSDLPNLGIEIFNMETKIVELYQFIEFEKLKEGEVYTISVSDHGTSMKAGSFTFDRNMQDIAMPYTRADSIVLSTKDEKYLSLRLYLDGLATARRIEYVKLELGEIATPFVPKSYTEELLNCQRYYVEWNGLTYSAQTTFGYRASIKYPTRMRIKPTLITEMLGGGTATVTEGMTQDGFTFGSSGNQILIKYKADAEIY